MVPKASTTVAVLGILPNGPLGFPKLRLPTMKKTKQKRLWITPLYSAFQFPSVSE